MSVVLDTAVRTNGLTRPLKDGDVTPAGFAFNFIEVVPHIAAFRRMVRDLEFDVSEVAPTTYVLAKYFEKPFTALPVFMTRGFHHGSLVCRPGAGIAGPKDLEGKRVGVRAYTVTSWIWQFGMLQSEYGVDPSKITFVTDDEDHVQEFQLPANVEVASEGTSLAEMIHRGELDAAFTGNAGTGRVGPPEGGWNAAASDVVDNSDLVPLFADADQRDRAWYEKTGILPIHGLIVLKDDRLREDPQIAVDLFEAFQNSTKIYLDRLHTEGPQSAEDRKVLKIEKQIGGDPLPIGFQANRTSIKALADFVYEAGITPRRFAPEELIAEPLLGT